jgi:hypothetical protein
MDAAPLQRRGISRKSHTFQFPVATPLTYQVVAPG